MRVTDENLLQGVMGFSQGGCVAAALAALVSFLADTSILQPNGDTV